MVAGRNVAAGMSELRRASGPLLPRCLPARPPVFLGNPWPSLALFCPPAPHPPLAAESHFLPEQPFPHLWPPLRLEHSSGIAGGEARERWGRRPQPRGPGEASREPAQHRRITPGRENRGGAAGAPGEGAPRVVKPCWFDRVPRFASLWRRRLPLQRSPLCPRATSPGSRRGGPEPPAHQPNPRHGARPSTVGLELGEVGEDFPGLIPGSVLLSREKSLRGGGERRSRQTARSRAAQTLEPWHQGERPSGLARLACTGCNQFEFGEGAIFIEVSSQSQKLCIEQPYKSSKQIQVVFWAGKLRGRIIKWKHFQITCLAIKTWTINSMGNC